MSARAGLRRARLDRAAAELATPESDRLTEQHRAQTLHVLRGLFDSLEERLRHLLGLALAGAGSAGRDAVAALSSDGRVIVWPRVEQAVLAAPYDILEAALTRAAEHGAAAPRRALAPGEGALARLLARRPDSQLSQRAMNLVIAESHRQDAFGEPRLMLGELGEDGAARAAWLAGAAMRAFVAHGHSVEDAALDRAVEDSVRTLLADRGSEDAMAQAASLVRRLDTLDLLDDEVLAAFAEEGQLLLLAAGLASRAGLSPALALGLIVARDGAGLAVLARALGVGDSLAAALAGLTLGDEPVPVEERLRAIEAIAPSAAKRQLAAWRRDPAYAAAIEAVRG